MAVQFVPEPVSKKPSPICWTEEHDRVLVRELIANNPFDGTTKKGTPARGAKWNAVINLLLQIREPSFKVGLDQKVVRNRYNLLALKYRQKIEEEERASGISIPELTELEKGLEVFVEWEDATDIEQMQTAAQKKKTKEEKTNAEEVRKRAMESLGENKRRREEGAENNNGLKRRRSSGADTLEYLKERNERMDAIKHEEMELKREELRLQSAQQEAAIQQQQLQLEAQQRQFQEFQTIMLSIVSKLVQKE